MLQLARVEHLDLDVLHPRAQLPNPRPTPSRPNHGPGLDQGPNSSLTASVVSTDAIAKMEPTHTGVRLEGTANVIDNRYTKRISMAASDGERPVDLLGSGDETFCVSGQTEKMMMNRASTNVTQNPPDSSVCPTFSPDHQSSPPPPSPTISPLATSPLAHTNIIGFNVFEVLSAPSATPAALEPHIFQRVRFPTPATTPPSLAPPLASPASLPQMSQKLSMPRGGGSPPSDTQRQDEGRLSPCRTFEGAQAPTAPDRILELLSESLPSRGVKVVRLHSEGIVIDVDTSVPDPGSLRFPARELPQREGEKSEKHREAIHLCSASRARTRARARLTTSVHVSERGIQAPVAAAIEVSSLHPLPSRPPDGPPTILSPRTISPNLLTMPKPPSGLCPGSDSGSSDSSGSLHRHTEQPKVGPQSQSHKLTRRRGEKLVSEIEAEAAAATATKRSTTFSSPHVGDTVDSRSRTTTTCDDDDSLSTPNANTFDFLQPTTPNASAKPKQRRWLSRIGAGTETGEGSNGARAWRLLSVGDVGAASLCCFASTDTQDMSTSSGGGGGEEINVLDTLIRRGKGERGERGSDQLDASPNMLCRHRHVLLPCTARAHEHGQGQHDQSTGCGRSGSLQVRPGPSHTPLLENAAILSPSPPLLTPLAHFC